MLDRQKRFINLRTKKKGGDLLDTPEIGPGNALRGHRYNILLIHGYNNDVKDAITAYDGFRRTQKRIREISDPEALIAGGKLIEVFWPGDANLWIFSPLAFPWVVGRASESAHKLADVLSGDSVSGEFMFIDIIAHSLGCRVAVELMNILSSVPDIYVRRCVLMAAAVPTYDLDPGDDLRRGLDSPQAVKSLYSGNDMVLTLAFPPGQTLAGEGFLPTALGHEFLTGSRVPLNLSQDNIAGARHSDYWGWNDNVTQGEQANRLTRGFLDLAHAGSRESAERVTLERPENFSRPTDSGRIPVTRTSEWEEIGDSAGWYD